MMRKKSIATTQITKGNTLTNQTNTKAIPIKAPRRTLPAAVRVLFFFTLTGIHACKSTTNHIAETKSAEEPQSTIKSEISDILIKPAQAALNLLEPIATQFKSIQQLKAAADGAIQQADSWARAELESARRKHRENGLLWDVTKVFAGPDGLLNYRDVKNTLACTPDSELKDIVQILLNDASKKSPGYTKDGILVLIKHIQDNTPLPPFRSSVSPFRFLNEAQQPAEIRNEINRQIAETFSEQCLVPKDQIHSIGAFDLIKKYCINALDLRSQGILAGVLNLHYDVASIDNPSNCDGRVLTKKLFQSFYKKYIEPSASKNPNDPITSSTATAYLKIQTAKYFGPFQTDYPTIILYEPTQDFFVNHYLQLPSGVQITLRGGLPVATVKKLMDDFVSGQNNLLLGNLGQLGKSFKTNLKCRSLASKFVPTKTSQPQHLDFTYYKDEDEFRAYFDPKYDGQKYFSENIRDRDDLRRATEDSRFNKSNAFLKEMSSPAKTLFFHQSLSNIDFFGVKGSSLTRSRYTKLPDGRVRLDNLYQENASDGQFSVSLQRVNQNGGFEIVELDGYSIPYTIDNSSFMTPCLEFAAQK